MPVHLYGQPADMQKILEIARKYNLKIVEDSAQAHGSTVKLDDDRWQKAGSVGDCGCFSFYPSKNLGGMGDGGMVVTNDLELSKRVRMLRDCGRTSKYEHVIVGYNSRLDTLQAAMLRVKLKKLEKYNAMRQAAAKSYNKFFKGLQGVIIPSVASFARHVYHVYAIRTKRRNELFEDLKNKGVGVVIHYPIPLHLQKAYANLGYKKGELPVAERVADEIISLPMFPYITQKQIKFVAEAVKDFL
jgi:dTDP-4-amino-4,6-dideoxygalactose transaminase